MRVFEPVSGPLTPSSCSSFRRRLGGAAVVRSDGNAMASLSVATKGLQTPRVKLKEVGGSHAGV